MAGRNDAIIRKGGAREAFVESEDAKHPGQPSAIASGDHVVRGRLGSAASTAETKGELIARRTHRFLQAACKTYTRMALRLQITAERVARRTPSGNARRRNASGGLAVRRLIWQNQRQRKRQGR